MIVIAHLSDTHIDGGQRSSERTRAVMDYLESLPYDLDAVLVTGDIADHALPAEYEQARSLLTSRHPVVICPGNHDERAAFRQFLLGQPPSAAPVNQVHHTADFVIALCDSSVPGKDEGFLEDETLAWLEDVLAQAPADARTRSLPPPADLAARPLHRRRPPVRSRAPRRADGPPPQPRGLPVRARPHAGGDHLRRTPTAGGTGSGSTLRLPWEQHTHPEDYVHLDQPPALAFHVWDDEGRLTTHYRCVTRLTSVSLHFEGPQQVGGDAHGDRRGLLAGDVRQPDRGLDPVDGGVVVTALGGRRLRNRIHLAAEPIRPMEPRWVVRRAASHSAASSA